MTIWTWIENHQTLTVGIIGFLGVIVTLCINAMLARTQHRKELCHERQTLRVALAAELKINREAFVNSIKSLDTNTALDKVRVTGEYWVPTDEMEDVYRSFIDRIGLLSQFEIRKVMNAYLRLRTYTAALLLQSRPLETDVRHVPIPSQMGPMLIEMQESLIGPLNEAIDALERARDEGLRWKRKGDFRKKFFGDYMKKTPLLCAVLFTAIGAGQT